MEGGGVIKDLSATSVVEEVTGSIVEVRIG